MLTTSLSLNWLSSPLGYIRDRGPTQSKHYPQPPLDQSAREINSLSFLLGGPFRKSNLAGQVEQKHMWFMWNYNDITDEMIISSLSGFILLFLMFHIDLTQHFPTTKPHFAMLSHFKYFPNASSPFAPLPFSFSLSWETLGKMPARKHLTTFHFLPIAP